MNGIQNDGPLRRRVPTIKGVSSPCRPSMTLQKKQNGQQRETSQSLRNYCQCAQLQTSHASFCLFGWFFFFFLFFISFRLDGFFFSVQDVAAASVDRKRVEEKKKPTHTVWQQTVTVFYLRLTAAQTQIREGAF